ncbi:iron-sulfur cluster repair di-iron protein [Aliifodinibius sp. S!AR15-10]|uniref:iron-sulfur cluster repair di-iron protein n=1 Tax=Aliifodinibius sp. S!AR15-10 TaxID=2950437 RepID=UPI0028630198|nr:iron-sulfur cluster repair di-iron protein [Aliifodinibius sp. S!AR15-10]MDR8393174.1 iron-sulfur cluster repair di-iron protein [Aliifodinibius sp. S!AR15-10]
MNTIEQRTIGEIVANDYRTAQVFKKYGLDFCCGGGRTVAEACEKKGVDVESITNELLMLGERGGPADNYKDWSPDFLVDYIVNNHHNYVRNKLPEIRAYAQKVAKVHGRSHPENVEILKRFEALADELTEHLEKEEQILFPYVKLLVDAEKNGIERKAPHFKTAANPISMMESEHEEAGSGMEEIQALSNNFTPPKDACATYRVLYANLKEFQEDLHKHVHLENNILFPKTLELEKRLN